MRSPQSRNWPRRLLMLSAACYPIAANLPAHASGHGAPAAHAAKEETQPQSNWRIYDLGEFELREIQTTRKKTTEISFSVFFSLSEKVTKEQVKELEHWKNRLRDQVLTAVRTAKNLDFQEPDLERLRRIIMFRIRRLLKEDVVEDVLLSKFTFRTE